MLHCDVLVVGGGPAGLSAAIALRQKGLDVLLADALYPPIDKACGEGLMPDARRDLASLGIVATPQHGAAFEGIRFVSGRYQVAARFAGGNGLGIRRLRLHALFLERCRALGVRMVWGGRVHGTGTGPLYLNGESCRYRYVVGADGQSSRVRQISGLDEGKVLSRRFGSRCHYRMKPWSPMVEVHWGDAGQAYVTPVGPEEICVATVARSPEMRMEVVLASLPWLRTRLQGAAELSRLRGALTTTRKLRRVVAGNVALAGDASGSADAVTGQGIAMCLQQSLLLAEAIAADDLELYQSCHPSTLRLPHLMSRLMLGMDTWPWLRHGTIGLLSAGPWLFAQLLDLHLQQPAMSRFWSAKVTPGKAA